VAGLGADDTFTFSSVAAATPFTFGSSVVQAGAGNDTLNITTAASLSATSIGGGEGKDTINFGDNNGAASYNGFTVNGGQASDTLNFAADLSGTASAFSINGGLDDDSISIFSSTGTILKAGLIAGGKGDDTISAGFAGTYNLVTVNGGLGEDNFFLAASAMSGVSINGGQNNVTDSDADSADFISVQIDTNLNGTVLGNGGNDTFFVSAGNATGLSIGGGQGADTINVEFAAASGATVGAGKGNDTINILTDSLQDGANLVVGGDGNDDINIGDSLSAANLITVEGGAGADTLFGGFEVSATNLKYASFSDSTLSTLDTVDLGGASAIAINSFVSPGVGIATASAYTVNGKTVDIDANGFVGTFATAGITTLTAAVEFLDQVLSANEAVAFNLNTAAGGATSFLFVQGGDTDLVVQYDKQGATAATAGTLIASGIAGGTKLELTF